MDEGFSELTRALDSEPDDPRLLERLIRESERAGRSPRELLERRCDAAPYELAPLRRLVEVIRRSDGGRMAAEVANHLTELDALEPRRVDAAIDALIAIGRPALPALMDAIDEPNLRPKILEVVKFLGARASSTLPGLIARLDIEELAVTRALRAMGTTARPAIPALARALIHAADEGRSARHLTFAIAEIGPDHPAALPALIRGLERPRSGAALAIALIGPAALPALPRLLDALESGAVVDRPEVALAIGGIGPAAREALPQLEALLENQTEASSSGSPLTDLRQAIRSAVEAIRSQDSNSSD